MSQKYWCEAVCGDRTLGTLVEETVSLAPEHKLLFGRLYHSVWNERRLEFLDQLIADTHALVEPTMSGTSVGPAAYKRQVERFLSGLPDLKFTVDETVSDGDRLVVYWTMSGTQREALFGVPATNKKVNISGVTMHEIADGKILESMVIWDRMSLAKQLGIELPVEYQMLVASAG
jgi:steroid delta-isomerase-like uncharacterized protein